MAAATCRGVSPEELDIAVEEEEGDEEERCKEDGSWFIISAGEGDDGDMSCMACGTRSLLPVRSIW